MKKIRLDVVNENLYYEKLSNGLDVYIIKKDNYKTNYACFGTKFGGLDLEFIPFLEKDYVKMPSGIAHFLEHKLFEQENGVSALNYYKSSGYVVNAYTNYKTTKYYCYGTNNFEENLLYLIDFVQTPYLTDENIEKEKGIILEEAYMTLDDPDRLFSEKIMDNVYSSDLYKNNVIGSIEDIKSITKEDLNKCYKTFYAPSNMHLLIVTNNDVNNIIDLIKNNQRKKKFDKVKIIKKEYEEDEKVNKSYEVIKADVKENRMCYSIKISLSKLNCSKLEAYDYLSIYLGIIIGNLSEFNLKLKNKRIIKDDLMFRISSDKTKNDTYIIIKIFTLTDNPKKTIELLEKELTKKNIKEEDFNIYKKSIISDLNYAFNSIDGIMEFMKNEYDFFDKIDSKSIKDELHLNYDDFNRVINNFNNKNNSIVIMENKL